jgi:hypothetical protein
MTMRRIAVPLHLLVCLGLSAPVSAAEPAPLATRVIERIPRTPQELSDAHDKSDLACVQLAEGVPLAQQDFSQHVYADAKRSRGDKSVRGGPVLDWGRWPVIDYGTRMTEEDRKSLPFFTSGVILDVVDNTYITMQARVHRSSPNGEPYLHYMPIAGVGEYGKLDGTTAFAALQQVAVSNVRGLGLFLKPGQPRSAQALRTLVVSIKGNKLIANKESDEFKITPTLELLLVRMRVDPSQEQASPAGAVKLHAFGTIDGLTKLVYFNPYATPESPDDCTIRSTIRITEYSLAGQLPSARAAREVRVHSAKEFTIRSLDEYARRAGLAGDALDNASEILDAIIDGKLR